MYNAVMQVTNYSERKRINKMMRGFIFFFLNMNFFHAFFMTFSLHVDAQFSHKIYTKVHKSVRTAF